MLKFAVRDTVMKHTISIIILLATWLLMGCEPGETSDTGGKLKILATTGMIADVTQNIVGDAAEVTALMGPGVDPHLYKATQSDLAKMNDADIILYNGLHLEGKMVEVLEKLSRKKPVIAVANGVSISFLRKAPDGEAYDPHIWFDVYAWRDVTRYIADTLQALDTANANLYENNFKGYNVQLNELDMWVQQEIQSIPADQRILITAHDAFEYFGQAYGIEVRGLQGISTISDFGLQDVTALVNLIVERNIKAVFVESSVSDRAISAVVEGAQKRGHEVKIGGTLYSDAMGAAGTPEGTYIGMVKHNVTTITEALK